jgi:pyruvate dehydrogenase E2 component (dihydrolipoamide acetyltransferase)
LNEGDEFQPGTAICEVETDKAVVTYDATEDGVLAKILVGKGEIQVGQPIMVTVENRDDVKAFASFTVGAAPAAAPVTEPAAVTPPPVAQASVPSVPASSQPSNLSSGDRVFASPLARTLAREAALDLSLLPAKGYASGPNGRILGDDVRAAISSGVATQAASSTPVAAAGSTQPITPVTAVAQPSSPAVAGGSLQELFTLSKRTVPHYFLSVEVNLSKIQALRSQLGADGDVLSVQDFLVKAAAKAMAKVPEVNAAWMDSFVRKYDQVDINFLIGAGDKLSAPVLRDVNRLGLSAISKSVSSFAPQEASAELSVGTFAIHNLGLFGVKGAAPIVLPPQACALAFGTIVETVIPHPKPETQDGQKWTVAPMMTVTLSCDHRVVDGAIGAAWLAAFKEYAQEPLTLLL